MESPELPWRWAPAIFAAQCGLDVVMLDTRDGDYLVLAGAGDQIDLDPATGRLDINDGALAVQLSDGGLIVLAGGSETDPRRVSPEARADIFSAVPERARISDMLAFAWVMIEMIPLYWLRSFPDLVSGPRKSDREDTQPPSDAHIRSAIMFERLFVWVPFHGKCLFRAAMLRRFLRRRGLDAAWVFGARTWPFAAHCWLQVGEVVINDRVDHVAGFTPLMVV